MSDFVDYLISRCKRTIPPEILNRAFPTTIGHGMYSMDDSIYQDVIMDIVYKDFNLLGGTEQHISLNGIFPQRTEYSLLYRVPLERTGGKRILSALSLDMPAQGVNTGGMLGAHMGTYSTMTTNLRITGVNTFEVMEEVSLTHLYLRCRLGIEPNFMDWSASSIEALGEFAELACKIVCYTRLSIAMGDGAVNGGSVNSYLRQHLDEMSDANERYEELKRSRGKKLSLTKDQRTRNRLTRLITPSFI